MQGENIDKVQPHCHRTLSVTEETDTSVHNYTTGACRVTDGHTEEGQLAQPWECRRDFQEQRTLEPSLKRGVY